MVIEMAGIKPGDKVLDVGCGTGNLTLTARSYVGPTGSVSGIDASPEMINKARKSVANFKLRQGQAIGCRVTLRREVMYEFFDRLVAAALPRIRDFRGVSPRAFDGRGSYSLGLADQSIFPEIDLDKIKRHQGMDITIVTTAPTDGEAYDLLKLMGMPFAASK